MATDPTEQGWYAVDAASSEIGDLCNVPVSAPFHFYNPSRLWSNADGACVP
jgi:hypothetical protein